MGEECAHRIFVGFGEGVERGGGSVGGIFALKCDVPVNEVVCELVEVATIGPKGVGGVAPFDLEVVHKLEDIDSGHRLPFAWIVLCCICVLVSSVLEKAGCKWRKAPHKSLPL